MDSHRRACNPGNIALVPDVHAARPMRLGGLALFLLGSACTRPSGAPGGPDGPGPVDAPPGAHDARPMPGDGPAIDAPITADAAAACKPANMLHGDGHHHPGEDCMNACHFHGFSVAGTLYLPDGTTPATNATVTIVDANHNSQDLVVSTNGNFFSYLPVAFPLTVTASLCPSTQMMVTQPTAGGCNATGCHEPGGAQGVAHL